MTLLFFYTQKMEDNKKRNLQIIIIVAIFLAAFALTLGLVFGLKSDDKEKNEHRYINNGEDDEEIINSYDNTDELIKRYPLANNVTVLDGLERNIQNRLLTGFENWNKGFKAWKKWGDILYTNESIYNVNGVHMTLAQYQASMDVTLKRFKIELGQFHNMIINGNYTAIYYDDYHYDGEVKNPGTVMEFVRFKD